MMKRRNFLKKGAGLGSLAVVGSTSGCVSQVEGALQSEEEALSQIEVTDWTKNTAGDGMFIDASLKNLSKKTITYVEIDAIFTLKEESGGDPLSGKAKTDEEIPPEYQWDFRIWFPWEYREQVAEIEIQEPEVYF